MSLKMSLWVYTNDDAISVPLAPLMWWVWLVAWQQTPLLVVDCEQEKRNSYYKSPDT